MSSIKIRILLFTVYCLLLTAFWGCASLQQKEEDILAIVNGEHITKDDLKYSLEIAHRREDLSSASTLNLSQFIQKLIDDRLIIQEARSMGMDEYPEVQQAIQTYILRESVVRLHDEEIVQKVQIKESDIIEYHKKNYERLTLGIIEASSEEEAKEQLEQLRRGRSFSGKEIVLNRNSIMPLFEDALSNLKTGEYSDVLKTRNKYYIVKLIDKKEAPDEELERVRESIEKAIRKRKERERSDEYLKYLREQSRVKVDSELLSNIRLDGEKEEKEKLSKDTRAVAEVNGSVLTVKDFISIFTPNTTISKEKILDNWIDLKLIDHEALSRHYEKKSDLKDMVHRYENQLLKNTFTKRIIAPQIIISEKTLKEYYASHQERFTKPIRFKIQQITVKTMDEARDILDNLQKGADFSWSAKKRSLDSANEKGGDIGWLAETQIPNPVREIIDTLKPGDISKIIKIDSHFRIIRLQDKKEGEVEEFNKVKNVVSKAYFEEQLNTIFNTYVAELKKGAEIRINNEAVQSLEEGLQK